MQEEYISIIDDEEMVQPESDDKWTILIVDDDEIIHKSTILACEHEQYLNKGFQFLHAYSGKEALEILHSNDEIEVALIDVVMDSFDDGLLLVEAIRESGFHNLRIILRTGQPGYAPELSVVTEYDINDYRTKSELTKSKLLAVLVSALKSYQQIWSINYAKKRLELIINASDILLKQQNLSNFSQDVLMEIDNLLNHNITGFVAVNYGNAYDGDTLESYRILSAIGKEYIESIDSFLTGALITEAVRTAFNSVQGNEKMILEDRIFILKIVTEYGSNAFVFIKSMTLMSSETMSVLKLFGMNITASFRNMNLISKLDEMAFLDQLTGLPNFNFVERKLSEFLEVNDQGVSFINIHLNSLGKLYSLFGNDVLKGVFNKASEFIRDVIGNAKIFGRAEWGDFAIVLPRFCYNEDELSKILHFTVSTDDLDIPLSSTITVVHSDHENTNPNVILQNARLTMSLAKESYRNRILVYTEEFTKKWKESLFLHTKISDAFSKKIQGFEVFLQGKFDIERQVIVGAEALSRWRPDGEWISPEKFIPIIEESGYSDALINNILDKISNWKNLREEQGKEVIPISINLSMNDITTTGYAEKLLSMLKKHKLNPRVIEFEITESMIMSDLKNTIMELHQLKDAGYNIAVDDFGTGFSSLSYIDKLPIDILKIDRSFVTSLSIDSVRKSMAATIVAMADAKGLKIVAEGIETDEQAQALRFLGCKVFQGFLYSKPTEIHSFNLE